MANKRSEVYWYDDATREVELMDREMEECWMRKKSVDEVLLMSIPAELAGMDL